MFKALFNRGKAARSADRLEAGPIVDAPELAPSLDLEEPSDSGAGLPAASESDRLLRRWSAFARMQQRVIHALVSEIQGASGVVETEADALSQRFQRLASSADRQSVHVGSLADLAVGIEVAGKKVAIDEIASLLESTLANVVEKILMLSKESMAMVYALDELSSNVGRVETCMAQLQKINGTTNLLALNARMEAERAGRAGAAFRVVASEVRELSKSTDGLTGTMGKELASIIEGIATGHATLKRVATVDMSDNVLAKERLEVLLKALLQRSEHLSEIVADAGKEAEVIATDVGAMVTGIQFQDRTRQRLEHVVDTLNVVDRAIGQLNTETDAAVGGSCEAVLDGEWVNALLNGFKLSEMRTRFVEQVLQGKETTEEIAKPAESGTVELF